MKCPCCNKTVNRSHFACRMAAKGGAASTEAKAAAARANGAKGGRPRKSEKEKGEE